MDRKALIKQIQEYDLLIQSHTEEDFPKSIEELESLSEKELKDWLKTRIIQLQFFLEQDDKTICH